MVRYPAPAARDIFIFGPGTIAKDRPEKFGICPMLGRWSVPTWELECARFVTDSSHASTILRKCSSVCNLQLPRDTLL